MAHSEGLDHFRRGEPLPGLPGASPAGFDHFRRGEPVPALETVVVTDTETPASVVVSFVLPAPGVSTTITPAAVVVSFDIPAPVAGDSITPDPLAVSFVIPAPTTTDTAPVSPARAAATSWEAVLGTLCDVLESAPLSLAPVSWHGENPSAAQLSASECYDLDLGLPGDLLIYSAGIAEALHPVEVVIYKRRAQWRDARDDHADLTDLAEDVRRVVRERSGLEIAADPILEVMPADEADALEGRVRFRVRYQLAVTDS